ncbi:MAG: hypothetical protein JW754_02885 [Candidatus Aenigmarchaeota archaeon]|nr:hypothetical protein [Candidatus Aenigmarchaeota archaeon]
MAKNPGVFERFPASTVLIFNLVNLSVFACGIYLLYLIWPVLAVLFAVYIAAMESMVYREGCRNCWYYGKRCMSGRGCLAKMFMKKGDPKKFSEKDVSAKAFIPSSLISVVPVIAGIYLFLQGFDFVLLGIGVWPIIVMFLGNPVIYGELSCPHCKQSELGCPVSEFFMKKAKKKK